VASNYGPNFGIRRADEHNAIREGRFKTPVGGTPLLLGTCVEIDPDNPGFLRQGASDGGTEARSGASGLLVSEDQFLQSVFSTGAGQVSGYDFYALGRAPLGKYAVILSGTGAKVWLRNTATKTIGGRTITGVTMFAGTPDVGDRLGWNGSAWAVNATAAQQFMEVVLVKRDPAYDLDHIEAVLLV